MPAFGFIDLPPGHSRIGLGLASLGRPGYINLQHHQDIRGKSKDEMKMQCHQVLDAAYTHGIRYFDAARSYGLAESFLSDWLTTRHHSRARKGAQDQSSIMVGSKWGYLYTANWVIDTQGRPHEVKDHSIANLLKQTEETETFLGTHIGLYQIHSATLESGVLEDEEVLKELERIKLMKGWRIGLSCSGPKQGEIINLALEKRMSDEALLFDSVQVTWNLLEQGAGVACLKAKGLGLEVIVKEGMANGRILDPQYEILAQVAHDHETTCDAVALASVLLQPFEPLVLSGASTAEQLASNLKALYLLDRLSPDTVKMLMTSLKQPSTEYWKERSALPWN